MDRLRAPIVFIGSMRTGTTVISEVVFRHEDLAWPSNYQERFPSVLSVNLARNLFDNGLWRFHGQKPQLNPVPRLNRFLFKPAEAWTFWEHLTGPQVDFARGFLLDVRPTPQDVARIRRAFSTLVACQRRRRLACKLTGPARIGYLTRLFPDAVFVNIVRDEQATLDSWLMAPFWRQLGLRQLWWKGAYTAEEEEWARRHANEPRPLAALQHRRVVETTKWELAEYGPRFLTLRYEDFVAAPRATVKRMLDFADLRPSRDVDAYLDRIRVWNRNGAVSRPGASLDATAAGRSSVSTARNK